MNWKDRLLDMLLEGVTPTEAGTRTARARIRQTQRVGFGKPSKETHTGGTKGMTPRMGSDRQLKKRVAKHGYPDKAQGKEFGAAYDAHLKKAKKLGKKWNKLRAKVKARNLDRKRVGRSYAPAQRIEKRDLAHALGKGRERARRRQTEREL